MTIFNWVAVGATVIVLIAIVVFIFYKRKLKNLDGFDGFERDIDNLNEQNITNNKDTE